MGLLILLALAGAVSGSVGGGLIGGPDGVILGGSSGLVGGVMTWFITGVVSRTVREYRLNRYFSQEIAQDATHVEFNTGFSPANNDQKFTPSGNRNASD
jgi:hypothetical protein